MRHVQHAVRLLPLQLVLDVHGRLRLHREADQAQYQKDGRVRVLSARLQMRLRLGVALVELVRAAAQPFGALVVALAAQQRRMVAVCALQRVSQV